MKKSELKTLIREAILEEYGYRVPDEEKEIAKKFFVAAYNHIKKIGSKKTFYNQLPDSGGGWARDVWTAGDAKASDINQHYSKVVHAPNVAVSMARNGDMIWSKGTLADLKELLIGLIK